MYIIYYNFSSYRGNAGGGPGFGGGGGGGKWKESTIIKSK